MSYWKLPGQVFFESLKFNVSTRWVNTSSKSLVSLDNESKHSVFQTSVQRILGSCPRLMFWKLFIHAPQVSEAELMTPDWEAGRNILISTISTKWNQTAATASKCINCWSTWQSQQQSYALTAGTKHPPGHHSLSEHWAQVPFPGWSHPTTLQPSQSTASPLGTTPFLTLCREREATSQRSSWFHFSDSTSFYLFLSSRCRSFPATLYFLKYNIILLLWAHFIPFPRAKWNWIRVLDQSVCKETAKTHAYTLHCTSRLSKCIPSWFSTFAKALLCRTSIRDYNLYTTT